MYLMTSDGTCKASIAVCSAQLAPSDRENMASQVEPRRAYDLLFKLMLVGDSGVGKTCVMVRYTDDSFATTFISTIGMGGMER